MSNNKEQKQAVWTWNESEDSVTVTLPGGITRTYSLAKIHATNRCFVLQHGFKKLLSEKTSGMTAYTWEEKADAMDEKAIAIATEGGLVRERKALSEADKQARALKKTVKMAEQALEDGTFSEADMELFAKLTAKMNKKVSEEKTYKPDDSPESE